MAALAPAVAVAVALAVMLPVAVTVVAGDALEDVASDGELRDGRTHGGVRLRRAKRLLGRRGPGPVRDLHRAGGGLRVA